jgi:antirestriction protein ArdC
MNARTSLHHTITQHIIEAMKDAIDASAPWLQNHGLPRNAASQQFYRGINILHLWVIANKRMYSSSSWATYKQWAALGAQVKKGEKGAVIIFYQPLSPDADDKVDRTRFNAILKCSTVFNAEQVDGYDDGITVPIAPLDSINHADQFVQHTLANITHGGDKAYYTIKNDTIVMPDKSLFIGSKTNTPTQAYYAVLLHELTHWSGHVKRCNRLMTGKMANESYAMEELVAELGAAFLCAELGITPEPRQDHANYIASWISALEDNDRAIFAAAKLATEAVSFLHALQPNIEVAA